MVRELLGCTRKTTGAEFRDHSPRMVGDTSSPHSTRPLDGFRDQYARACARGVEYYFNSRTIRSLLRPSQVWSRRQARSGVLFGRYRRGSAPSPRKPVSVSHVAAPHMGGDPGTIAAFGAKVGSKAATVRLNTLSGRSNASLHHRFAVTVHATEISAPRIRQAHVRLESSQKVRRTPPGHAAAHPFPSPRRLDSR